MWEEVWEEGQVNKEIIQKPGSLVIPSSFLVCFLTHPLGAGRRRLRHKPIQRKCNVNELPRIMLRTLILEKYITVIQQGYTLASLSFFLKKRIEPEVCSNDTIQHDLSHVESYSLSGGIYLCTMKTDSKLFMAFKPSHLHGQVWIIGPGCECTCLIQK